MVIRSAILAGALLLLFDCSGCSTDCKDEILGGVVSPDAQWVAATVLRDCGATTAEHVGVSIHRVSDKTIRPETYVFVVKHLHPMEIVWQGNEKVTINCHCSDNDVRMKLQKSGSIEISYTK